MEIHIRRGTQKLGPFSLEEVRAKVAAGELRLDDLAWRLGLSDWVPLGRLLTAVAAESSKGEEHGIPGVISSVLGLAAAIGFLISMFVLPKLMQAGGTRGVGSVVFLNGLLTIFIVLGTFLGIVLGLFG